jgi:hypothetical protein
MKKSKECYNCKGETSIKEESSSRIAIKVPHILKAEMPPDGLFNTGVTTASLTNPKSNNLLRIFPCAIYFFYFTFLV